MGVVYPKADPHGAGEGVGLFGLIKMRFSMKYIDSLFFHEAPITGVIGILNIASVNPSLDDIFLDGVGCPLFNLQMYNNYTGEVGNGGHFQYFWNSTGDFTSECALALNDLNMPEFQVILEKSLRVFKGGSPAKRPSERISAVEALNEKNCCYWLSAIKNSLIYIMKSRKKWHKPIW